MDTSARSSALEAVSSIGDGEVSEDVDIASVEVKLTSLPTLVLLDESTFSVELWPAVDASVDVDVDVDDGEDGEEAGDEVGKRSGEDEQRREDGIEVDDDDVEVGESEVDGESVDEEGDVFISEEGELMEVLLKNESICSEREVQLFEDDVVGDENDSNVSSLEADSVCALSTDDLYSLPINIAVVMDDKFESVMFTVVLEVEVEVSWERVVSLTVGTGWTVNSPVDETAGGPVEGEDACSVVASNTPVQSTWQSE